MIWLGRICAGLVFLFSLMMAGLALVAPDRMAETLGLGVVTGLGLNTVRADMGAFFLVSAIGAGGALFKGRTAWLWLPTLLYGLAVTGRFLGLAVSGVPEGVAQPIVIELVIVALSVIGLRFSRQP
ncbi:MAG: hypothetical protein GYB49_04030 [Alphaproteobacteria bacterium]|nr:hypothetical protein [Alphaproteobacteria bacterium]|tara:strand:+ start:6041 stop:6418 length:378 start_codon:yes stop_codon:yes gene_type:complete